MKTRNKKAALEAATQVPLWLLRREKMSLAQWQREKYAEAKALRAAFEKYREGCAYGPISYADLELLETKLNGLVAAHGRPR
ncbi:hypothetical protein [Oleiharenicola lentus]|uniref:hypothetical protein n=1 Tax=Oleiharenicola lentus TaxID=2508720 RepID=UPI003F680F21